MKPLLRLALGLLLVLAAAGCGGTRLRVMTYNIHHGEGVDGRVDLLRVAEVIQRENPDIVAIQEVDRGVLRTGGRDLAGELAALLKMQAVFGRNIDFQGGFYGNAVLTRHPIVRKENHLLPRVGNSEQRGVLEVLVKVGPLEVVVLNTHLDHRPDPRERELSVRRLAELASGHAGRPVIVCGDFNTPPAGGVYELMRQHWKDAWSAGSGEGWTIAAGKPYARIDYILVSGPVRPVRAWVPESVASDHLPVVADLVIR